MRDRDKGTGTASAAPDPGSIRDVAGEDRMGRPLKTGREKAAS